MSNYSLEVTRNSQIEEWQIVLQGNLNFVGQSEPILIGSYEKQTEAFAHLPAVQTRLDQIISTLSPNDQITKWQFRSLEQAAE